MKTLNKVSKTAIGSMASALIVIILLPSVIDMLVYVMPAFASLVVMICVIELGRKWAFGVYACSSIISLLIVPNKEAVVMYVAFLGYYAIVKSLLESKRMPRVAEYIIKFAVFNVSVIIAFILLIKVFGMSYEQVMGIEGESGWMVKYIVPIMLVAGNIAFLAVDFLMTNAVGLYLRVWQKKFRKMFRFK